MATMFCRHTEWHGTEEVQRGRWLEVLARAARLGHPDTTLELAS